MVSAGKAASSSPRHTYADPGLFLAAGPRIRTGQGAVDPSSLRTQDVPLLGSILDVCPTLLALFDLPVGEDMPGSPLLSVLDPDWVAEHPLRTVATHDSEAWKAARAKLSIERRDDRREAQLRQLGYLAGGDDEGD